MLLQQFMGEKFGRDNIWEGHLAGELWNTKLEVRAVLDEIKAPLGKVLDLKVGDTLMLDAAPDATVTLKSGSLELSEGRVGRIGHALAVRVERPLAVANQQAIMKVGVGS
jgi:flagellar motor switch protein FliM